MCPFTPQKTFEDLFSQREKFMCNAGALNLVPTAPQEQCSMNNSELGFKTFAILGGSQFKS